MATSPNYTSTTNYLMVFERGCDKQYAPLRAPKVDFLNQVTASKPICYRSFFQEPGQIFSRLNAPQGSKWRKRNPQLHCYPRIIQILY